ncbi:hypothetical protein Taro_002226 [Colocasia esculenta]|uniref:Aminotransferase-like plant mobile domain-containing protein n=1 Tax=Colocasia esculenta TaxID=4460 RepID=A0A843TKD8_COLES|nr:hypothetical protein [Colocasia esculenta]
MEEGNAGEGSSQAKRHAERRSSRRRAEVPSVEEEEADVEMEVEEEAEASVMNVEEARMKRAKAIKLRDRVEEMGFGEIFRIARMRADPALTQAVTVGYGSVLVFSVLDINSGLASRVLRPETLEVPGMGLQLCVCRYWPDQPVVRSHVVASFFLTRALPLAVVREFVTRGRVRPSGVEALRNRWDTEATSFVFPWGHMIPSLKDVSRITGLRIYGRSSLVPRVALQESVGLFEAGKKAGEIEDEHFERLVRINRTELASEPGVEADLDLHRFLVLFLGRLLFAMRGDAVPCRFLPLMEDLAEVGGYAWGAAFLAHQFDSLGASERQTSTSGFFPFLQPLGRGVLTRVSLVPIARRWDSRRDSRRLGDQLERLQEAIDSYPHLDVVWQPYLGESDEGQPWLVLGRPYFGRSVWVHALNLVLPLYLFLCRRSLGLRHSAVEFPVDVAGEIASFQALLYSAMQDRELERVRRTAIAGASSSRAAESSQSDLEDRLEATEIALRTATDRAAQLQGQVDSVVGERDQLRIRAEATEAHVAEAMRELAALRVRGSPVDQEEPIRLRADLQAQQTLAQSLQKIVTTIGRSHSRSRSGVCASRATGASVGQYLAGSSSRRRNEEEERHCRGKASAQSGRGGGEMLPPPDRQEGSEECGGGQ